MRPFGTRRLPHARADRAELRVVTFKFFPGQVFTGKVVSVLEATSTGQPSGTAVTPRQVTAAPFAVRVKLDNAKLASSLPAGTAGDSIFTEHVKPSHIIRTVILRQIAILNYVNPFCGPIERSGGESATTDGHRAVR